MNQTQRLFKEGFSDRVYSAGAIAVGKKDRILYKEAGGFVSFEEGAAPVTEDTLFDMASLTKILSTTFSAFHMIEDGTLSLLDSLSDFFPDVPMQGSFGSPGADPPCASGLRDWKRCDLQLHGIYPSGKNHGENHRQKPGSAGQGMDL